MAVFLMNDGLSGGGTERQFTRIAGTLSRARFAVHVGCLRKEEAFAAELGEVAEFRLGGLLSARAFRSRARLWRHLRARRVQLAHSFDWYSNLTLAPVARLAGVPAVLGSHRSLGDFFTPAHFRLQDAAFRLCDRVVCNSEAAAGQLAGRGVPGRKLVVISNGLPQSAFDAAEPAEPRAAGVLRVGLVARMNDPVKQHPLFLGAAARVHARFPGVEFWLVGDGPLRPQLEALASELGIAGAVKFLGERMDVTAVLASLDLTVLCSSSESLSNAILESMAAGVPVVATRVGGNPELVEHERTGLLTPPGDEAALAAAIERMLRRPEERRAWGQLGRGRARARFSLEGVLARYADLYDAVLAEKAPRRIRISHPPAVPRIALLAPSTRMVGGQAAQAKLLVDGWRRDGRAHAELVPVDTRFFRPLAWCERVPGLRTVVRTPLYLVSVWRAMGRSDVAHVFSASYWSFLLAPAPAWLLARLRGVPVLINYRSGEASDHLRRSRVAAPILRRCDALVTPSGYLKDVFAEFGLTARVIPNLVDLDQFQFRLREPLRPALVCTRGFGAYYRVDLVLRAFQRIQQTYPEAGLCLAGDGPQEPSLRALARELGVRRVTFCGRVERAEVPQLYQQADIFLNASEVDNMPVSVLEAFASGTPVVTTAAGGIPYIVEHERTGLLSPPGDWQALAANVIRLLRDPALATRLALSGHDECPQYSWDAVSRQWLDLYRQLSGGALRRMGASGTRQLVAERGEGATAEPAPYEVAGAVAQPRPAPR
jgi:glycosyltransferase involved in cell wall biosynthesis